MTGGVKALQELLMQLGYELPGTAQTPTLAEEKKPVIAFQQGLGTWR